MFEINLVVLAYLLFLNIATFFVYGMDKRRANRDEWRISESILLALAFVGGTIGAFLGMRYFRHKTKKMSFLVKFWVIVVIQVLAIFYLFTT